VYQKQMSYRYAYPNGAPVVSAASANGYGVNSALMTAGYPNGTSANMYEDDRRR
jgi:hypothetical protein